MRGCGCWRSGRAPATTPRCCLTGSTTRTWCPSTSAPGLVHQAEQRLATLGYHPTLVAGDGAAGACDHGPYDRIIATAAVPEIPIAWIQQLKPGGRIGPILPIGGHFMWLRPDAHDPHRPHEHTSVDQRGTTSRTTTSLDPATIDVDNEGFRFLLQLQLHGARSLYRGQAFDPKRRTEYDAVIVTPPTAHAPKPSEATRRLFDDLGRPDPGEFGVVANDSTQFVWFDDDSWYRWSLPLT